MVTIVSMIDMILILKESEHAEIDHVQKNLVQQVKETNTNVPNTRGKNLVTVTEGIIVEKQMTTQLLMMIYHREIVMQDRKKIQRMISFLQIMIIHMPNPKIKHLQIDIKEHLPRQYRRLLNHLMFLVPIEKCLDHPRLRNIDIENLMTPIRVLLTDQSVNRGEDETHR